MSLIFSLILIHYTLAQQATNCYVQKDDPSTGMSRVYFTYPVTSSSVTWRLWYYDNFKTIQYQDYVPGYTAGYPSNPQANTQYYIEFSHILSAMDDSETELYCTDPDGCGASISSDLGSSKTYCGNTYTKSPTTATPTKHPTKSTASPTSKPTDNPVTTTPYPTSGEICIVQFNAYSTYDDKCTGWDCDPPSGYDYQACWLYSLYDNCYSADTNKPCWLFKWEWGSITGIGCKDDLYLSTSYRNCDNTSPKPYYGYKYVDIISGVESGIIEGQYSESVYLSNVASSYTYITVDTDDYSGQIGYKLGKIQIVDYANCNTANCNSYYEKDSDNYYVNVVYFDRLIGDRFEYIPILDEILKTDSPTSTPTIVTQNPTEDPTTFEPTTFPTLNQEDETTKTDMDTTRHGVNDTGNAFHYTLRFVILYILTIFVLFSI